MKPAPEPLFPDGISEVTAAVLCQFLYALAADCEARYGSQLRSYHAERQTLIDPERPWITKPPG